MIWSDLFKFVMPHLPGCPEMLVEDYLRQAAIDFCTDTKVWEEQMPDIYITSGLTRYQVALPPGVEIIGLVSAKQRPGEADETWHFPTVNVFGLVVFDPLPDSSAGSVKIRVSLRPSDTATEIPDRIGLHYKQPIYHKAIAELQLMPNRDWSSPQTVASHMMIYQNALSGARFDRTTGNNEAPIRTKPFVGL